MPVTAVLRDQRAVSSRSSPKRRRGRTARAALVARQRPIKVGPIVGNDYPVLDGLKPGERVVVSGAQKLADGAPIAPLRAAATDPSLSPDHVLSTPSSGVRSWRASARS